MPETRLAIDAAAPPVVGAGIAAIAGAQTAAVLRKVPLRWWPAGVAIALAVCLSTLFFHHREPVPPAPTPPPAAESAARREATPREVERPAELAPLPQESLGTLPLSTQGSLPQAAEKPAPPFQTEPVRPQAPVKALSQTEPVRPQASVTAPPQSEAVRPQAPVTALLQTEPDAKSGPATHSPGSIRAVRTIYIAPMGNRLNELIAAEIRQQLGDRLVVVKDKDDADAVMIGGGEKHTGSRFTAGFRDDFTASVTITDKEGVRQLWSADAGDRQQVGPVVKHGGAKKVAERLVSSLRKALEKR